MLTFHGQFKPTQITIGGTFIVLIAYFLGKAWAAFLPRGDRLTARWRERGGQGKPPFWLRVATFINPGPWYVKSVFINVLFKVVEAPSLPSEKIELQPV